MLSEAASQLAAAEAAYAAGDVGAAVESCLAVSQHTGDAELLPRAALVVHGVGGEFNGAVVGLCDQALAALPDTATTLRARVLAQRALVIGELLGGAEVVDASAETLAVSEAVGDDLATMRALQASHAASRSRSPSASPTGCSSSCSPARPPSSSRSRLWTSSPRSPRAPSRPTSRP